MSQRGVDPLCLCCNPRLCEVVLEVLDAPKGHDTLPLCSAAAEWLQRFVGRVHVRVVRELAATGRAACGRFRAAIGGGVHDFSTGMKVGRTGEQEDRMG